MCYPKPTCWPFRQEPAALALSSRAGSLGPFLKGRQPFRKDATLFSSVFFLLFLPNAEARPRKLEVQQQQLPLLGHLAAYPCRLQTEGGAVCQPGHGTHIILGPEVPVEAGVHVRRGHDHVLEGVVLVHNVEEVPFIKETPLMQVRIQPRELSNAKVPSAVELFIGKKHGCLVKEVVEVAESFEALLHLLLVPFTKVRQQRLEHRQQSRGKVLQLCCRYVLYGEVGSQNMESRKFVMRQAVLLAW